MTKLDINSLLAASIRSKADVIQEGQVENKFNIDLEGANKGDCDGCENKFNLNLESVAFEERINEFLGESTIANLRAAIASGMAVNTVLEARINSRVAATA